VHRDGGKLFQMSGLQTANARCLQSVRVYWMTAAWVDAECNAKVIAVGLMCRRRQHLLIVRCV